MGVLFDGRQIDPADVTVRAAVNQIDSAVSSVTEDHDRRSPHVEFHDSLADRKPLQCGGGFRDDDWAPLRHLLFATDAWVGRVILGDPSPWHPLDLPFDELPDDAEHLLQLVYSLVMVSFPVEAWRQPHVPDSGAAYLDLLIEPIVLGGGKRILPDDGTARRFELTEMERANTGVICTRYVRAS